MSIFVGRDTRVVVQGITGRDGGFHTRHMLDYGTRVVAGVTPGKGGSEVHGVPVFDSMDAAVRATGRTPLARALVACASGRAPSGALAANGASAVLRVRRLSGRGNSPVLAAGAYLAAVAVFVVPTVAVAVPWLTELRRLFNV